MNFKRMAGFMLALVLILSQLPAQVLAAGSVPAAGPAAVTGLTRAGTQEDPYQISSEAEQEGISLEDKPVALAIREVASGALRLDNAEMAEKEAQSAFDAPEQEGEGSPATAEDEE